MRISPITHRAHTAHEAHNTTINGRAVATRSTLCPMHFAIENRRTHNMRKLLSTALAATLICGSAVAAQTGFEQATTGPFTALTTDIGEWFAAADHAQIDSAHADLGKRCLHIIGGNNRAVELTLRSAKEAKLIFNAERWTSRSPFEFRISARNGTIWKEIYNGDKVIGVGGFQTKVSITIPDGTDKLRFSCTAPDGGGILIDNVCVQEPAPMQIQTVTSVQIVTPLLVRNEADPLLQIQISTTGNLQPIRVTKIQLLMSGTELIESISVQHAGTVKEFATAKPATEKMIFSGDLQLEEGENILLVNARLKAGADIDRTIDAACDGVMLSNGKTVKPETIAPAGEKRLGMALRKAGDDNCVRYRIPGMDVTPKGTLIAVYDARWKSGGDLPGDIDVGMSRSTDGGRNWEPMKVIMDMGNDPEWRYDGIGDPCVLVDQKTGTIWVGALWSHGNRGWHGSGPGMTAEETGQYMLVKSEDDGRTWSKPINITSQIKQPDWCLVLASPGRGITMRDGTLVMPSQFQDTLANKRMPHSTIIYSKDRGATWKIGTGARSNTTECRIVELTDGSLMLNMRDNRGGSRSICTTRDLGRTWSEHPTSRKALPEPVCNAGLISVKAGETIVGKDMLIFCNPDSTSGRHHMSLKVSFDDGNTWPEQYHMLLDAGNLAGYPSMALIDKETLGVLYEGSRANLTFQRIKIRDLLKKSRP